MTKICVLGAGITGMSTAIRLQENNISPSITVLSENFDAAATSEILKPSDTINGPESDSIWHWLKATQNRFTSIARSEDAGIAGVQEISGYVLSSQNKVECQCNLIQSSFPSWRDLVLDELESLNGDWVYGGSFVTAVIDKRQYIWWLQRLFQRKGGHLVKRRIQNFRELLGDFDLVINCCGLSAATLAGDSDVQSIRVQTSKVKAPWVKQFYFGDLDFSIVPGFNSITLRGQYQTENSDQNVDRQEAMYVRERCLEVIPSLKDAVVEGHTVVFKCERNPIRVGSEIVEVDGRSLKVVHNYGHGIYSMALSWGCAEEVSTLAEKLVSQS